MSSSKSKHILFIQPSLEGAGGIEKVVPTAAQELKHRGYVVSAAVFYNSVPADQTFWHTQSAFTEVPTKHLFHRLLKVWQRLSFLQKSIKTVKPDIIIVSAQGTSIITLLGSYLRLYSVPVIVYVHEGVDVSGGLYRKLMRFLYRYAQGFICVSKGIKAEIVERLQVKEAKTVVAYNAVSVPETAMKATYNFAAHQKPYFVTASRIELIKGIDVLVKQFIEYAKTNAGTLFILGTGSLEVSLRARVEEAQMTERIIFLGYSSDVLSFVSQCDVYVSLAPSEPFGLSLLEALSVGVPVVATDVPYGPREILAPTLTSNDIVYPYQTDYGILCVPYIDSKDFSEQFTNALNAVVENKKDFSVNHLQARAADFSVPAQVNSIEQIINNVVKKHA